MDQLLQSFSILGLAALAVMIVVAVGMTRKVITYFFPVLIPMKHMDVQAHWYGVTYLNKWARFYNELFLYALPYMWAAVFAIVRSDFVYGPVNTYGGRLFLAFLIATFSATIFKAMKKSLPKSFGVDVSVSDTVFEQVDDPKVEETKVG